MQDLNVFLSLTWSVFQEAPWGFPCGSVGKSLPANAGDTGLTRDPGRSHMPWSN